LSGRLVVLDASFADIAIESETAAAYGVTVEDAGGVSGDAIVGAARDADGVLVQYGRIDESVIERCSGWRVIGRYGVGVDNVDVAAASRRGIAVINVPDYCLEEVATHTAALALALLRRVVRSRELIDDGRWGAWSDLRPVERLSTCTLGLVGVGRIGAEVARLLGPFFDRVIAHDVASSPTGVEMVSLEHLFSEADVVSLHCPLTPETVDLIDGSRLGSMKRTAYLINVSRGGLVDTAALAAALHEGVIAGAALDVLPVEPPDPSDPILSAPNLLLTNHDAWYSETSLVTVRQLLAERCSAYLNGDPVPTIVNAGELSEGA
jgi:D-3-phosphoglycerate dehydrogenase / 2-oxoglutarate reductase